MVERLMIATAILGMGFGAYVIGTRWQTGTATQRRSPVLNGLQPGIPAVIYFWSEFCAPCKLAQTPALEQLREILGPDSVQVIAVNAVEQPEIADEWGVLSLPTTFIIDKNGEPRRVNNGLTHYEQLKKQIESL